MAAGVTGRLWEIADIVALIEAKEANGSRSVQKARNCVRFNRIAVFLLCMGCLTVPGQADPSGYDLKEMCFQPDNSQGAAICMGYVVGMIGTFQMLDAAGLLNFQCDLPTEGDARSVFLDKLRQYLESHPKDLHYAGAALTFKMLHETYSCGKISN